MVSHLILHLKVGLVFFCIAMPLQASQGIRIEPAYINANTSVTLYFPEEPPQNLVILNPKGQPLFIFDPEMYISQPFKNFRNKLKITFQAQDLKGKMWHDGVAHIKNVFAKSGVYEFYFADNLETEPTNTYSFCAQIFFSKERLIGEPDKEVMQTILNASSNSCEVR